jgi:hypothetical protein
MKGEDCESPPGSHRMKRALPFLRVELAVLFFSLVLATAVQAQYRATIQGVVTDPQGAIVPGAKVDLTDKQTGRTLETTTNDAGLYTFGGLAPTRYSLTVEKEGFKKKVLDDLGINPEQSNSVNVQLDLGSATETVNVTGDATPLIDTETATISGTISQNDVQNLPSIGRDPFQLIRLTPGVFGDGATGSGGKGATLPGQNQVGSSPSASIFMTENQPGIVANGTRNNGNSFQVDGVQVNSLTWGGSALITPNEESVKEVQIQANQYSAENGRGSGAQVLVVSQNGTNVPHGSLFIKAHRPGLNAFQSWNGPGGKVERDEGRFNQYGGSIGGPVIKNRFFLFFSYETLRNNTTNHGNGWYVTPQFYTSVIAAHSNSIASEWAGQKGVNASVQTINAGATTCANAGLTEGVDCATLPNGLDIGSPLTNALGTNDPSYGGATTPFGIGGGLDGVPDVFNINTNNPTIQTATQYNGRADFQATAKDLIAFSVYWTPNDTSNYNGPARPINLWHSNRLNYSGALLWNRTFTPSLLNEARFNVVRWYFDEEKTNPQMLFGFPVGNISKVGNIPLQPSDGAPGELFGPPGPGIFYQTSYNIRDTLTKVYKSHSLKFGTDNYKDQVQDTAIWAGLPPAYQFNNLWDWGNDAPVKESGAFDPRNGQPTGVKKYIRSNIYALFAQDDYKVRPNLTLNVGLRWEYFGPIHEKYGNLGVVDLGSGANTLSGLQVKTGVNAYNASHNNWGPQIGFAWSPGGVFGRQFNNRFVLRGGFGMSYSRPQEAITLNGRLNPPVVANFSNLTGSNILYAPSSSTSNIFGFPANPATVLTFDPSSGLPTCAPATCAPVSLTAFDHNLPTPRTAHYSILGEYDLGGRWVASVGYQGSQSRHFFRQINNLNWLYPNNLNPAVGSVDFYTSDANAHYNALLTEIRHQFARSFSIDAQYSYSRCMDHGSQDYYSDPYPFNVNGANGYCDYDTTHNFKAYGIWAPRFFANGWKEKVIGGWTLSGIFTYHTGFPFGPFLNVQLPVAGDGNTCNLVYKDSFFCQATVAGYKGGAGNSFSNSTFERPNGNFPGLGTSATNPATGDNPYFTMPTFSASGFPSAPGILRNNFRGPHYRDFDFTLGKEFGLPTMPVLGENAKIAFHANFYNLFNTLNLSPLLASESLGTIQLDPVTHAVTNFSPDPHFGQVQSALGARVIELQARFSF